MQVKEKDIWNHLTAKAATGGVLCKKMFLEI